MIASVGLSIRRVTILTIRRSVGVRWRDPECSRGDYEMKTHAEKATSRSLCDTNSDQKVQETIVVGIPTIGRAIETGIHTRGTKTC